MLLFLKNVERMSVFEWSYGQSEPRQVIDDGLIGTERVNAPLKNLFFGVRVAFFFFVCGLSTTTTQYSSTGAGAAQVS